MLQKLLAPKSVEFFSQEEELLGNKKMLEQQIHEITETLITALQGVLSSDFPTHERLRWAAKCSTKRKEDWAYYLRGIFSIFLPQMYGEEGNAFARLRGEPNKCSGEDHATVVKPHTGPTSPGCLVPPTHVQWMVTRPTNPLFTGRGDLL